MERLLIVNGSPRAPKSNSKQYVQLVQKYWKGQADTYLVTSKKQEELDLQKYQHILFVFPLYADAVPSVLFPFLKYLEQAHLPEGMQAHVLINCGFLEPQQNDTAVKILQYFCKKARLSYGMTLQIGSGEAILKTPFAFLVRRKIRSFVKGVCQGKSQVLSVTLPLSKRQFIKSAEKYWLDYGKRFHTTEEQMRTMEIESEQ